MKLSKVSLFALAMAGLAAAQEAKISAAAAQQALTGAGQPPAQIGPLTITNYGLTGAAMEFGWDFVRNGPASP